MTLATPGSALKVTPTAAVARGGALRFAAAQTVGCRDRPELRALCCLQWASARLAHRPASNRLLEVAHDANFVGLGLRALEA
jgi:hypothetical protein